MAKLKSGRYRHYKGNDYEVIDVAHHCDTEEPLVVYRCLYGDSSLWVRPLQDFIASVEIEDETVERFTYLGDME